MRTTAVVTVSISVLVAASCGATLAQPMASAPTSALVVHPVGGSSTTAITSTAPTAGSAAATAGAPAGVSSAPVPSGASNPQIASGDALSPNITARRALVEADGSLLSLAPGGGQPAWTLPGAVASADGTHAYLVDAGSALVRFDAKLGVESIVGCCPRLRRGASSWSALTVRTWC